VNSTDAPVGVVRDLHVSFGRGERAVRAVNGVDLELRPGERLAIVGESGSGKSVLSLSLLNLLPKSATVGDTSVVEVAGNDMLHMSESSLNGVRGSQVSLVFQDPMTSLDPVLRVGRQLEAPLRRHLGISRAEARQRALKLLSEVRIPAAERVLDSFPHELSGGMRQRVLIAMALSGDPELLVADEPTTALDVTVQAQIIRLLTELSEERHTAMILVTHDLGIVARFAHRVAVMYAGRFVEEGPVDQIFQRPVHPYTQGLLASIPRPDLRSSGALLPQIVGTPPDPTALPPGCSFEPRCPVALERCRTEAPPLVVLDSGQQAECWRAGDAATTETAVAVS